MITRFNPGIRFGFWYPGPHVGVGSVESWKHAFRPLGIYSGPTLLDPSGEDPVVGTEFVQQLMEGELRFSVGVLFRPDRGPKQRLESIIIIRKFIPEMFDYTDWPKEDSMSLSPTV